MSEIVTKVEGSRQDNDQYKYTKSIRLNPSDSGGEAVKFNIHVFENEDGTEWDRGELVTSCYGVHVTSMDFRLDITNLINLLQDYQETENFTPYSKEKALDKAQDNADKKQENYVVYPEPNLPGDDSWDYMHEEKWHREGHGEFFEEGEIEVVNPTKSLFSKEQIENLRTESRMIDRAKKKADLTDNTYIVHPDNSGY